MNRRHPSALAAAGIEPADSTPAPLAAVAAGEVARRAQVAPAAGVQPE